MRTAAKRDSNEAEIVQALVDSGCAVQRLSAAGIPDLLVYVPRRDCLMLLEVKEPKGHLTADQENWIEMWPGPVYVVRDIEDALKTVGVL